MSTLSDLVNEIRPANPKIAACFDEVERRLVALEGGTPPPTPSGLLLGLVPNAGFPGTYGPKAAALKPKSIREDHLSSALVDWAAANNADVLGLGGPLTNATVDQYPKIDLWEYDNEPYLRGVDPSAWARTARDYAKQFQSRYPNKTLVVPVNALNNGGDYQFGGVWKPWVTWLSDAAPDIWTYFDAWSGHPYNRNGGPTFVILDKVRAQLQAKGFTKPCWVTEVGWSVGTNQYQVSAATQAAYLTDAIKQLRTRPWVARVYWYGLRTWGANYEGSFGLTNLDGSERPAAQAFRNAL